MMSRTTYLVMVLIFLSSSKLSAVPVTIEYDAGAGPAPNPTTQGWTEGGLASSAVSISGTAAWEIDTLPAGGADESKYFRTVTDGDVATAAAQGWTLSVRVRVPIASQPVGALDFGAPYSRCCCRRLPRRAHSWVRPASPKSRARSRPIPSPSRIPYRSSPAMHVFIRITASRGTRTNRSLAPGGL